MIVPIRTGSQVTLASQGIYRPEAYGAVGNGVADDTAVVQAALDAVEAAGGGTVRLDQSYGYTLAAELPNKIGPYDISYGLWLNGSNVTIDGNSTGSLVLLSMPVFTNPFIGLLIGNGGFENNWPAGGWDWLKINGTWTTYVDIKNLTFNNSVLTDANLATLTTGSFNSVLALAFCRYCDLSGITIDRAWGSTGGITTHCSSLDCTVDNCEITLAYKEGFHFDGAEDSEFTNLTVGGFIATSNEQGISIATNTDYRHDSARCTVDGCTVGGVHFGIGANGFDHVIKNNIITLKDDAITHIGIELGIGDTAAFAANSGRHTVTGNTIQKTTAKKGMGIRTSGKTVTDYDGEPRTVESCTITGNTISNLDYGYVYAAQSKYNTFQHNTLTGTAESADQSGGTAVGNVIGPNP